MCTIFYKREVKEKIEKYHMAKEQSSSYTSDHYTVNLKGVYVSGYSTLSK